MHDRLERVMWRLPWALSLVGLASACGHAEPCHPIYRMTFPAPELPAYRQDLPGPSDRIVVIGDTQRTSFEGCLAGNEVNDTEQRILLADAADQTGVTAVILLGDMVFLGDSPYHWKYFDYLMVRSKLVEKSLFPLLGNHEYLFDKSPDLSHEKVRFERFGYHTYYAFTWGGVRMILLNANFDKVGADEHRRELEWLSCELDAVDRGCARGSIVFAHQSPYTQSPWVKPDAALQREVLPKFCGSSRKLAFISAHAHGYERWTDSPVPGCRDAHTPFIVTAGGGGPRPPERRCGAPHDSATIDEWPRPFNYLVLSQTANTVNVAVRMLWKSKPKVVPVDDESEQLALAPSGPAISCGCTP